MKPYDTHVEAATGNDSIPSGELASARAVLYRLGVQAFRHPGRFWGQVWDEIASGAGAALTILPLAPRARSELADAFDRTCAAARDGQRVRSDHARLLGDSPHTTAPCEIAWNESVAEHQHGHLLAGLSGFYRSFGLDLSHAFDERADHLSIELYFMQFLYLKEAAAAEQGYEDLAERTRSAQGYFLEQHLLRWAPACCARLAHTDPDAFHGRAADLVERLLAVEAQRFGLASPGRSRRAHRPRVTGAPTIGAR